MVWDNECCVFFGPQKYTGIKMTDHPYKFTQSSTSSRSHTHTRQMRVHTFTEGFGRRVRKGPHTGVNPWCPTIAMPCAGGGGGGATNLPAPVQPPPGWLKKMCPPQGACGCMVVDDRTTMAKKSMIKIMIPKSAVAPGGWRRTQ